MPTGQEARWRRIVAGTPEPPPRPSAARMAASLARTGRAVVVHAARTGRVRASEEVQAARWGACRACAQFDAKQVRCLGQKGCGCWLKKKIPLEAAACPLEKWPA